MLQALNAGRIISKELLWKDVRPQDREAHGERFILELIDWETNTDPAFYEHRHLEPVPVGGVEQPGGEAHWIYYGTTKFSGMRVVVRPGATFRSVSAGVHNVLVWQGSGTIGGIEVEGGNPDRDELLIAHDRATAGVEIRNTGRDDLHMLAFFGPDVNQDVPAIEAR
jgi:hypothetical protein